MSPMSHAAAIATRFGVIFGLLFVALFVIIQLTKNFADLAIPEPRTFFFRLAVMAAAMAALTFVPWVGWILAPFAAGAILQRWFEAGFAASAIVVALTLLTLRAVEFAVLGMILARRGG